MISSNDTPLRRNLARMLEAYAADQAAAQRLAHSRAGRAARTFRYSPTGFQRDAVRLLGYGDSEDVARTIHTDELAAYLGTGTSA